MIENLKKRLKSKELFEILVKLFYVHDLEGFRSMGAPLDEYSSEVKQLLYRLRFRLFLRTEPNKSFYGEKNKKMYQAEMDLYSSLSKEEVIIELVRTWESLFGNDGCPSVLMNGEIYPPNISIYREDKEFSSLAEDILKVINGEEVSFDTQKIDEAYRSSLIEEIKRVINEQGYSFEDFEMSGQGEIDKMNTNELNGLLYKINPPNFILKNNESEK